MKDASTDQAQVNTWWARWPDALIGVYCEKSGFFAVDLDNKAGANGALSWTRLVEEHGAGQDVAPGPVQRTVNGGIHALFRLPGDELKIPNNAGKLAPGVDLRSNGYICTGGPYTWQPGHGPDSPLPEAPAWLLDLIRNLRKSKPAAPGPVTTPSPDAGAYWLRYYLQRATPGNRNEHGFSLGCQLRDSGVSLAEAESIAVQYARGVPGDGYTEGEALASVRSAYNGSRREAARLPGLAMGSNGHGTNTAARAYLHNPIDLSAAPEGDSTPGQIPTLGSLTDTANAARLAGHYGDQLRWVPEWGWIPWDGKRWAIDQEEIAMKYAKATARSIYTEAAQAEDDSRARDLASWAGKSLNRSRLDSMLYLAKPELQARPENFDADPWLLNVANGILDLRTGQLKPHDKSSMLTKITGIEYNPAAGCPTWERFLDRIFRGDRLLTEFIRRAVGYSLTGDTSEQVFFFCYGLGANGKSTFANAIHDLLSEYAMKARAEALMIRRFDSIPEETAQIAGVRFLLAAELGEGQRLNEPLIKDLTGGDKLRARLLYRKSFEFYPIAKVWLYGNHKPVIHGSDEGIWRRPKLIPFEVTIPEAERDKRLPEKLRAELPGILAWAVRGCLDWQRQGLNPPAIVNTATAEFRAEQDIIGQFIDDCCIQSNLARVTAGALYGAYKTWCEAGGMTPKINVVFSRQLAERGIITEKDSEGKNRRDASGRAYYLGIGLREGTSDE
jgi:P4 family phage/plasmid primase-like protien